MSSAVPAGVVDILPLSPVQHGILFQCLREDAPVYITTIAARLRGPLDVESFARAWQTVVARHDGLRAAFVAEDVEEPVQVVLAQAAMAIEVHDWRGDAAVRQAREFEDFIQADRQRGIDPTRPPLMRLAVIRMADADYRLVWTCHHLLMDGWSVPILLKEVSRAYAAGLEGEAAEWAPPAPYRDYSDWLQRQDNHAAEHYWRERMAGFGGAVPLVLGTSPAPDACPAAFDRHAEHDHVFARDAAELKAFARRHGITLNTLVQGAWAILQARFTDTDDVAFGVTLAVRPAELDRVEERIGLFINTLPLRVHFAPAAPARTWLKALQGRLAELLEHAHSPLADVKRWSGLEADQVMFDSILVFENYPSAITDELQFSGNVSMDDVRVIERPHYPLNLQFAIEENLSLKVVYARSAFAGAAIEQLCASLEALLDAIVADPECPLGALPLLGAAERRRVLVEWNATQADYPAERCVHELFAEQVARTPEATALVWQDRTLTYRELDVAANRLAHQLRAQGTGPETIVGLCLDRSLDMIVGVLGVLKAGGAYLPLDPDYPPERLAFMLCDAAAPLVVTHAAAAARCPVHHGAMIDLDRDHAGIAAQPDHAPASGARPGNLAYVIYTSGSTGRSKGVMVGHRGTVNLALSQGRIFGIDQASRVLQFASFSFDACVSEIFMALAHGAALYCTADSVFATEDGLTAMLNRHKITHVTLPPTALGTITGSDSLPGLGTLIVAGEALSLPLAERWAAGRTMFNAYGPTEATVCASTHRCRQDAADTPPIGRPIDNTQIYILDRQMAPLPVGVVGELYIGGAGIARGYLNRPGLTAQRFVANPFVTGERLYRTGDLARHLPGGAIVYVGRNDFQLKIRGHRIEPGEVEAALLAQGGVAQAVVVAREDEPGEQRLVAYVVGAAGAAPDAAVLRAELKTALPGYMIPQVFVILDALPLTANGKVDRRALPAPDSRPPDAGFAAPTTATECVLAEIWADVLHIELVGSRDDFFELGGDSLLAMRVLTRIRETLGAKISISTLFDNPQLSALARHLDQGVGEGARHALPPLNRRDPHEALVLSLAQEGLWLACQFEQAAAAHNVILAARLVGDLDHRALERALGALVQRHESLRMRIETVDGTAHPVVDAEGIIELRRQDPGRPVDVEAVLQSEADTPFDLTKSPLLRATVICLDGHEHLLVIAMHHIITDGLSLDIVRRDLSALYRAAREGDAPVLPALTAQYADFAAWQREWLQGEVLEHRLAYWRTRLAGAPATFDLPTDRPHPAAISFRGARERFRLPPCTSRKLLALCRDEGVTPFVALLTAFKVLLSRWTGRADIILGAPFGGRTHRELEDLIGFFVNTLVLRTEVPGERSFRECLARVKDTVLGAHAHHLPFEQLVAELKPARDASRQVLFQVLFALHGGPQRELELPGLVVEDQEVEQKWSKLDLSLEMFEADEGFHGFFLYATDLFDAATIRQLCTSFATLLEAVVADPGQAVQDIPLLSEEQRRQLLGEWGGA